MTHDAPTRRHGIRRMLGRDPTEPHRAATPLELLYDLTFVVAFGVAGQQLAHGIAEGRAGPAIVGFVIAMFAIIWAWINFSWFASAFDTDDWPFRVLTMVQMAGVIVLAIGLEPMFASVDHGGVIDNGVMVAGYVVMRVALIAEWMRAGLSAPRYRTAAFTYALCVGTAQVLWVAVALLPLSVPAFLGVAAVVFLIDFSGPVVAETRGRRLAASTPWHAHHIAERFSLLAIIALGETVTGTVGAAQDVTAHDGWSVTSVVVIGAGVGLTFALWWTYFLVPSGAILATHRERAFVWGYGHVPVFGSIAAIGAGLHLIGAVYDPELHVSTLTVISAVAIPVMLFGVSMYLLAAWLVRGLTREAWLQAAATVLPVAAIVLAAIGAPLWACLLVVLAAPVGVVVSFELGAWRGLEARLDDAVDSSDR